MTRRSKLAQSKTSVIAGNLLMAIDGQSLFFQALTAYPGTVYDSVIRRKLREIVE